MRRNQLAEAKERAIRTNLADERREVLGVSLTPRAAEGVYADGGDEEEETWSRVQ